MMFNRLTDKLTISPRRIIPLIAVQWGCNCTNYEKPDFRNLIISLGKKRTVSLYYNGIVYLRLMLPFYIGIMIRWSGSTTKKSFVQTHIGWRLSGVPAITFRIQSDKSSFESNKGPEFDNHGQAKGFSCGTK